MKVSATEWVTFVDPDDWVEPTHVSTLYNAQKQNGYMDVFLFDYIQEFDGKTNIKYLKNDSGILNEEWVNHL